MPRGATNPIWSPDGTTIAFTSTTRSEELPRDEVQFSETTRRRETDVRVITDPAYRANGVAGFGYVDSDRPSHVWTIASAADGEPHANWYTADFTQFTPSYLKRPTVMVRFPNENHELSRSGKPWHRVERLQHIIGWFDKHLLGKTLDIYDER